MAITILPNQALAAAEGPDNKCNTTYYLPSQRGDNFTLQGFSTNNSNVDISNGSDFNIWTLGGGWLPGLGNLLSYDGSQASATTAISPALNLQAGNIYQFRAIVTVTNKGTCTSTEGAQIYINDVPVPMPNLSAGQGSSASFVVVWYYLVQSVNSDVIKITFNHDDIQFKVGAVYMYQYSTPLVVAYDANSNYIQSIEPVYIKYFDIADNTGTTMPTTPLRFDIQFNLNELPDGCYTLQIFDGSGNVADGNFDNTGNWALGANWTIADNEALYAGNDGSQTLQSSIAVIAGQAYTLMFKATGVNANGRLTAEVVFSDSSVQQQTYEGLNDSSGYLSFNFTAPAGTTGNAALTFLPAPTFGHSCNFQLSDISVVAGSSFLTSNNINFRTAWDNTHLFSATNNDGAFNFDYSQGLTHYIRLWARMKYKEYDEEVDEYNFSDNSNVLMNSSIEKVYEIIIGDAAEFVHDCLSMMRINDHFYVDGSEYIRTGTYALKQRKSTELSSSAFDIKPIAGVGKNWAVE